MGHQYFIAFIRRKSFESFQKNRTNHTVRYLRMEKSKKEIEKKLELIRDTTFDIKQAWKKEVERFNETEKLLGLQNIRLEKKISSLNNAMAEQNLKIEDQVKTIKSLQDLNQAQTVEIDFLHKKLEGQQLQIDILEAEKKSLDARFNEINLKLKQQQQVSNGEIPPLIPNQEEVKKEQNSSIPLENTTSIPQPIPQPVPQPSTTASKQEKKLKRSADLPECETEPKKTSFDEEPNRFICVVCLEDWYNREPRRAPGAIVKTFLSVHRLRNHVRLLHQGQGEFRHINLSKKGECDSDCMETGEQKKFKCTARVADNWNCHQKFHCRLHYDRHIEIDHANIQALDKYSLAKLYEKHFKKQSS